MVKIPILIRHLGSIHHVWLVFQNFTQGAIAIANCRFQKGSPNSKLRPFNFWPPSWTSDALLYLTKNSSIKYD
jgi:hypothetical protein